MENKSAPKGADEAKPAWVFSTIPIGLGHMVFARMLCRYFELRGFQNFFNAPLMEDEKVELEGLAENLDEWWEKARASIASPADEMNDALSTALLILATDTPDIVQ